MAQSDAGERINGQEAIRDRRQADGDLAAPPRDLRLVRRHTSSREANRATGSGGGLPGTPEAVSGRKNRRRELPGWD
ncbi:hypothetical protein [Ancylobacter lacus]|uniref:hypothetical protein n=1 Tax=Ancylobacter lacus TaxID=2579970 RepID=UPI001BD0E687|nr:hypothetical protein [Ancylobacter lacus]MBS7539541.1 hypothetical protein [Ancylobacter lacus]